jgi:hypothetical protein
MKRNTSKKTKQINKPGLQLEQRVLICDIDEFFITLSSPVSNNSKGGITFLTILAHNPGIIVRIGGEEVFWVVIAINDDFTKSIVNMYILASLTHKMFQELSEQTKSISENHKQRIRTTK